MHLIFKGVPGTVPPESDLVTKTNTMINLKLSVVIVLLLMATGLNAQTGPVAAGGDGNGPDGSFSLSIGQIDYDQAIGTDGEGNHGLQQAVEIYPNSVTGVGEKLQMTVYPNPTFAEVHLKISADDFTGMHYRLIDATGRTVAESQIDEALSNISLQYQASGIYFLNVQQNNEVTQSFKLVKN